MNFWYLSKNFEIIKHWRPINKKTSQKELTVLCKKYKLFSYFYHETYKLCKSLPKRKDGSDCFIHPCNVVKSLLNAKINDEISFCAGISHDYIEEIVDLYAKQHKIKDDNEGKKILDYYAIEATKKLKNGAIKHFANNKTSIKKINEIISVLILLTRYKRHYYYNSLSRLFKFKEKNIRLKAIEIKLSDRLHNILSLSSFDDSGKIYQCYKNLFIINSTKEFIISEQKNIHKKDFKPLIKLFKKCSKATFDALLSIEYDLGKNKKVFEASSILQLALQKYKLEYKGLDKVTTIDSRERHPIRLFEGIIRKYDYRLHYDFNKFEKLQTSEKLYCKSFFKKLSLNSKQIEKIIDYKDAFTFKVLIARLLYEKGYTLKGFTTNKLFL
jgi:hypothetical protein